MGTHDDMERDRTPLSTEDLAGPGAGGGADSGPPTYPGEATGENLSGGSAGTGTEYGRDENDEEAMADRPDDAGVAADEPGGTGAAGTGAAGTGAAADERAGNGAAATGEAGGGDGQPLLGTDDTARYQAAWGEIQGRFVDDPREAVTAADTLVAEVMQSLAGTFASHKQELEGQWQRGDDVATEDLRQALQHYRSFFNRLLKA
ncbi:hypothetical protein AB0940_22045 [Streptomyces sp. NPDC006656]|uniref:hypothetical protein n=1 Tax=Streptomyces sp. NPDC006656 TaxID=3156899 RepID=UPI00345401A6